MFDYREAAINDLCEYYGVSAERAIQLGTRSPGRRPDLPGSPTCGPVIGKTLEEIWEQGARESVEDVFGFYREMGAWASFRQCVRQCDMPGSYASFLNQVNVADGSHVVEYGCGVAPFVWTILASEVITPAVNLRISLSDVPSEHFTFGVWRCKKMIERRGLANVALGEFPVLPDALPQYDAPIDVAIVFEVLEHVHNPIAAMQNLLAQMSPAARLIENFIAHDTSHADKPGPDLGSAHRERDGYYALLQKRMDCTSNNPPSVDPDGTRIWRLAHE